MPFDTTSTNANQRQVKSLAMSYVDEAVTSAKIPEIKGTKDWGTYKINGIKVKKLRITDESLDVIIGDAVVITVKNVSADFET